MSEEKNKPNESIQFEEKFTHMIAPLFRFKESLEIYFDMVRLRTNDLQKEIDKLKQENQQLNTLTKNIRIQGNIQVWKIKNWSEKVKWDVQEKPQAIFSPEYYTAAPTKTAPIGYKFVLTLFPNGNGEKRRTHVSLYFAIMKGDFDQLLVWPFKGKVTLTLLDPSGYNKHHVLKYPTPSYNRAVIARPTTDQKNAVGFQQFIGLDEIEYYLHHNALYIQVEIK